MMNDQNRKMEELKNQKSNRPSKKSLLLRLSSARNSRVIKVLSMMLAVMIVFGTTYSLILPAITVDQDSAEEEAAYEEYSDYDVANEDEAYIESADGEANDDELIVFP